MKFCEWFDIRELVHPSIYKKVGDRCIDFIHPNTKFCLDDMRDEFGGIICNDWMWKGVDDANYVDSGLRVPGASPYSEYSSHRFGCGFDLKFVDMSVEDVYYFILNNQEKFPFITRIENIEHTPTWLHIEIGAPRKSGTDIYIFNP